MNDLRPFKKKNKALVRKLVEGRILVRAQWTQSFPLSNSYITLKIICSTICISLLVKRLFAQAESMWREKVKKNDLDGSKKTFEI